MGGVTPHGIRHPDGATKAKNLGPDLEQMAHDIDRVYTDTMDGSVIHELVEEAADDIVPAAVDEKISGLNIVQAYPKTKVQRTGFTSIPLYWEYPEMVDAWSDTYSDTETIEWVNRGLRWGEFPVLGASGTLPTEVIPPSIARTDDVETGIADAISELDLTAIAGQIARPSLLWARINRARKAGEPVIIAFAGSSTTKAGRYVQVIIEALNDALYPEGESTYQASETGTFTAPTTAGLHALNVGVNGTRADTYLPDAVVDKLNALGVAAVLHMVGSNDYNHQINPATYRARIESRIDRFNGGLGLSALHILVQTYPPLNVTPSNYTHAQYGEALAAVAKARQNVLFLDVSVGFRQVGISTDFANDPLGLLQSDRVHMNDEGHDLMADLLYSNLAP